MKHSKYDVWGSVLAVSVFVLLTVCFAGLEKITFSFVRLDNKMLTLLINIVVSQVGFVLVVFLHEAIHALCAKILYPSVKLRLRIKGGIAVLMKGNLSNNGRRIIWLAPFAVFCVFPILYYLFDIKCEVFLYMFILNTSGSAFDFIDFVKSFFKSKEIKSL